MSTFKVALFDADGVTVLAPDYFSRMHARKHGLDLEELEQFFDDEFRLASIGKADLKELVAKRRSLWQLKESPEQLLAEWFASENHPNRALLEIIKQKARRRHDSGAGVRAGEVPGCIYASNHVPGSI